jgi:hypothetical protein
LAGLGVTTGAPDVLAWHAGKAFAVELKAEGGRPTPEQLDMLAKLEAAGVATALSYGSTPRSAASRKTLPATRR